MNCFGGLRDSQDLNRGVIKSDKATVSIPSLEFEIPPNTQAGVYTTVEGLLTKCCDDLEQVLLMDDG